MDNIEWGQVVVEETNHDPIVLEGGILPPYGQPPRGTSCDDNDVADEITA